MSSIWVGIDPRPSSARVLAIREPGETFLKAKLESVPRHPRALGTLLEALSLWEGEPIRAALAVGEQEWHRGGYFPADFGDPAQTPLYGIDLVPRVRRQRHRDGLTGLGDFRDVRRLRLFDPLRFFFPEG
jgi:hypothetical protein